MSPNSKSGLETSNVLGYAIERASAINVYWNLLIGVATAILGILASGKVFSGSPALKSILTAIFVIFTLSNLHAILQINRQRQALCDLIHDTSLQLLIAQLRPPPKWQLVSFHLFMDLAVIGAIWIVSWPNIVDGLK